MTSVTAKLGPRGQNISIFVYDHVSRYQRNERQVGLLVNFDGGCDSRAKNEIEDAIRKCVGEPPKDEKWVVSVRMGLSQNYCEVRVVTANQTRTRLFLDETSKLAKAIADWISMYPLR